MRRLGGIGLVIALLAAPGRGQPPAAPGADEQTLSKAQVGTDGPSLVAFFKSRTVGEVARQRIEALIRQLGDDAYAVRERASGELVAAGLPAVGPLRQATSDPDVEIARRAERALKKIERVPSSALSAAAARVLAARKPPGAIAVLLEYLPIAEDTLVAEEVCEAICTLAAAGGAPDPLLEKALDDAIPARRAAAAVALIRTGQPDAVKAARRALADPALEVRQRAALAMVNHAKDRTAVPELIALLGELPAGQVWAVQDVLDRLAGTDAPRVQPGTDAAARRRARDAWQEWWNQHGATLDMARLDAEPATLGLTLVVVSRSRPGMAPAIGGIGPITGSVLEVDRDKNVKWRIDGLQMPVDAVVLGRERVAVAEQAAQRVTVRDFRGKELWGQRVDLVNGLQRLPNGHLFVCARNRLVEFDASFRQVYDYTRPTPDIAAAHKLRSGEVVLLTTNGTVVRLDAAKKEIKSFPTQASVQPIAGLDVLPNGNVLKTSTSGVVEYDANGGPAVWQAPWSRPQSVQRLPNGNTLVAGSTGVAELNRETKQPIWDFRPPDLSLVYRAKRR